MAIRQRVTGLGREDAAVRAALAIAIETKERRIGHLEDELKTGSAFDAIETQAEIDILRKNLAIWKRMAAMNGALSVNAS